MSIEVFNPKHLQIDDSLEFVYNGIVRKGKITYIKPALITVEVNDNESQYKTFKFEGMKNVKVIVEP